MPPAPHAHPGSRLRANCSLYTALDPARGDSGLACVMPDGPCAIDTDGIDGINGTDGTTTEKNGSWFQEGSAGGVNTSNFDNVTGLASSLLNITAIGGKGGDGGNGYLSRAESGNAAASFALRKAGSCHRR